MNTIDYQVRFKSMHENHGAALAEQGGFHELRALAIDVVSCARNTLSAFSSWMRTLPIAIARVICGLGIFGGVLGVRSGGKIFQESAQKGLLAFSYGDTEGMADGACGCVVGTSYTGLSSLLIANGVMGLEGAAASASMIAAFGGFGIAMSAAVLARGGYGLRVCKSFQDEMDLRQEQGDLKVLEWLGSQIYMTQSEIHSMGTEDLEKALQKKRNVLTLRIGATVTHEIYEELGPLLSGQFDSDKATLLIEKIKEGCFKERIKNISLIAIGVIGFVGFICLMTFAGPVTSLLFAIGAIAWMTLDSSKLNKFIGEKCWALHSKEKRVDESCAKTPPNPIAS